MRAHSFAAIVTVFNASLLGVILLQNTQAAPVVPDVVRTRLIELIDDKGIVRAQPKTEDDGEVVLRLRDRRGNVRVKLAAGERGSGLLLADDRTQVGVHMISGVSRTTGERLTAITVADPAGAKSAIGPHGIK